MRGLCLCTNILWQNQFVSGSLITSSMGFVDIDVFFPNIEKNLTEVVWAHAVNSATYLNDTLAKSKYII